MCELNKKGEKGVVLVAKTERKTHLGLLSLPGGFLAGEEVSNLPERNKALQLTKKPQRVGERYKKHINTLKGHSDACAQPDCLAG